MNKWIIRILLGVVLLISAVLRLTGLDWDAYNHYQPDERYITWVATAIEWPSDWRTALHPTLSTLNPYFWPPEATSAGIIVPQNEPRNFAYGHWPLYLGVAATRGAAWVGEQFRPFLPPNWLFTRDILNGAGMNEFRHITAVSRLITALFDVGTVGMVFLLGRRVYGTAAGLLAAALLGLTVLHIQLAHFFAFDPFMTFGVVTAVYGMVAGLAQSPNRWVYWLLAAVATGMAIGAKFSAVLLVIPLFLALFLAWDEKRPYQPRHFASWPWVWQLAVLLGIASLTFALSNPFAVLDWTCDPSTPARQIGPLTIPAVNWRSCFLDNISLQNAMASGSSDNTFTRQYISTPPYLYHIEMQTKWGMGPFLGVSAFVGMIWAIWKTADFLLSQLFSTRRKISGLVPSTQYSVWVLLAWVLPFFLINGFFHAKFMRYMQPITPFLALFAAALLCQWAQKTWPGKVALAIVVAATGFYAWAFVNLYNQAHPWDTASTWIYTHIPPGAIILNEQWDDPLPTNLPVGGKMRQAAEYTTHELTWIDGPDARDHEEKLAQNLLWLAQADYVVIASNRVYGVVPRLPQRYPLSSQYHQLLFDGSLGYEAVYVNGRFPHLFGLSIKPDTFSWPGLHPPLLTAQFLEQLPGLTWGRADESFMVYDQPLTMIFQNVERKTADEMRSLFTE